MGGFGVLQKTKIRQNSAGQLRIFPAGASPLSFCLRDSAFALHLRHPSAGFSRVPVPAVGDLLPEVIGLYELGIYYNRFSYIVNCPQPKNNTFVEIITKVCSKPGKT